MKHQKEISVGSKHTNISESITLKMKETCFNSHLTQPEDEERENKRIRKTDAQTIEETVCMHNMHNHSSDDHTNVLILES